MTLWQKETEFDTNQKWSMIEIVSLLSCSKAGTSRNQVPRYSMYEPLEQWRHVAKPLAWAPSPPLLDPNIQLYGLAKDAK